MKQVTIILLLFSYYFEIFVAQDFIKQNQEIKDGQTIVSAAGIFELGFFSPNNSQNRYLGIWYKKISTGTVVWVANRNAPLPKKSGVLTVTPQGNLNIVSNLTNTTTVWSSNSSESAGKISPVAQLLDTGNLVVKDGNGDNILWQSFDYPTDTLLPDMKFGINKTSGIDMFLTSWSSSNDPALGNFTYRCHPQGYPQFFITRGLDKIYRLGNWNGITFSGLRTSNIMSVTFVFTRKEVYYKFSILNNSVFTRLVLTQDGVAQRYAWVAADHRWDDFLKGPTDICDHYGICGRYGSCNIANSPVCECLREFVPKSPREWNTRNFSNGCVREKPLDCQNGDRFLNYSNIKLPDTDSCWSNETTTLKECEILCSRNCSCTGYTTLDISKGSGCLLWFDDLIDIRQVTQGGQYMFIRMAASESGVSKGRKKERILVYILILSIGTLLLGLSFILYILRKKKKKKRLQKNDEGLRDDSRQLQLRESQQEDLELPLIGLGIIKKATSNFSVDNKLGEGGFGPVYKGIMDDGKEIAVKRLSKDSRQGTDEFKNEVVCIAKLQHRNLVKLLGCCIQGEEKMLIYEYLPNKGLDFFIFDKTRRKLLDWPTRLNIINGIARGLLYLHQDSRLRVIHRDLKLSNVLLDKDLNPKISDFGMARMFKGDETHANTLRVVGTYGYMSPEYQLDGLFSVKSDVFSFGVLVLEIVSGKKNRGFIHPDHHHNLLGHAWKLFKEGRPDEVIDVASDCESHSTEILRSMHIGLLCIQQDPEDRPNMSYVVKMLDSDSILPQPKQPGFFTERNMFVSDSSTSQNIPFSCNDMTITLLDGR